MIEKHVDQGGYVEYVDSNETRIAEKEVKIKQLLAMVTILEQRVSKRGHVLEQLYKNATGNTRDMIAEALR